MLLMWVPPLKYGRGLGPGVQVHGGQADEADQCYDEAGAVLECISASTSVSTFLLSRVVA